MAAAGGRVRVIAKQHAHQLQAAEMLRARRAAPAGLRGCMVGGISEKRNGQQHTMPQLRTKSACTQQPHSSPLAPRLAHSHLTIATSPAMVPTHSSPVAPSSAITVTGLPDMCSGVAAAAAV